MFLFFSSMVFRSLELALSVITIRNSGDLVKPTNYEHSLAILQIPRLAFNSFCFYLQGGDGMSDVS